MILYMWLQACALDIVLSQHAHNHVKQHEKMARNISNEIDLDNELEVFLLEGSKSGVSEYLVSLPQVEMLRICIQILVSLSRQYSLSFKYLLNIVIVKYFTIASSTIETVLSIYWINSTKCKLESNHHSKYPGQNNAYISTFCNYVSLHLVS